MSPAEWVLVIVAVITAALVLVIVRWARRPTLVDDLGLTAAQRDLHDLVVRHHSDPHAQLRSIGAWARSAGASRADAAAVARVLRQGEQ